MVPTLADPPATPSTDQLKLVEPAVEATNCLAWPGASVATVGETRTMTPVPPNATVSGELEALSWIVNAALRTPAALGVNVTLIVQLFPEASDPGQACVGAKSPLFGPEMVMAVRVSGAPPILVRVTSVAPDVVPIAR